MKNQNLHISQTTLLCSNTYYSFEESKFTYLSNQYSLFFLFIYVLKNQNLHISQTQQVSYAFSKLFWRIKIYISLKPFWTFIKVFKGFEESKFTYLSNIILLHYPTLYVLKNQNLHISQTNFFGNISLSAFWRIKIYISLKQHSSQKFSSTGFEESKFTYLSNLSLSEMFCNSVLKNQNLHISQTW